MDGRTEQPAASPSRSTSRRRHHHESSSSGGGTSDYDRSDTVIPALSPQQQSVLSSPARKPTEMGGSVSGKSDSLHVPLGAAADVERTEAPDQGGEHNAKKERERDEMQPNTQDSDATIIPNGEPATETKRRRSSRSSTPIAKHSSRKDSGTGEHRGRELRPSSHQRASRAQEGIGVSSKSKSSRIGAVRENDGGREEKDKEEDGNDEGEATRSDEHDNSIGTTRRPRANNGQLKPKLDQNGSSHRRKAAAKDDAKASRSTHHSSKGKHDSRSRTDLSSSSTTKVPAKVGRRSLESDAGRDLGRSRRASHSQRSEDNGAFHRISSRTRKIIESSGLPPSQAVSLTKDSTGTNDATAKAAGHAKDDEKASSRHPAEEKLKTRHLRRLIEPHHRVQRNVSHSSAYSGSMGSASSRDESVRESRRMRKPIRSESEQIASGWRPPSLRMSADHVNEPKKSGDFAPKTPRRQSSASFHGSSKQPQKQSLKKVEEQEDCKDVSVSERILEEGAMEADGLDNGREDVFTFFSWSKTRQDPDAIERERKLLRDSYRETAFFRAYDSSRSHNDKAAC